MPGLEGTRWVPATVDDPAIPQKENGETGFPISPLRTHHRRAVVALIAGPPSFVRRTICLASTAIKHENHALSVDWRDNEDGILDATREGSATRSDALNPRRNDSFSRHRFEGRQVRPPAARRHDARH